MLTCIACSKQQLADGGGENSRRSKTSSAKPAVKSLASQIKDAVLKLSGAYRQCKANGSSSFSRVHQRTHNKNSHHHRSNGLVDSDGRRDGDYHYPYLIGRGDGDGGGGSSSSTPAWDFTRTSDNSRQFEAWDPPAVMVEDSEEPKEWVAQVEPGVHITFLNLCHGSNDLKRIRFDRQVFNKWQAQRWWGENYDRIMELYNVQRFNRQAMPTTAPTRSEDKASSGSGGKGVFYPAPDPTEYFFPQYQAYSNNNNSNKGWGSSCVEARTTTSSRDVSISNASDIAETTEWVEENEPGVFVTIRQLANGTRDLRRVRFSRERFGEVNAKLWWEENRDRIHAQYL